MRRGERGRECGTLAETHLQSVHHRITRTRLSGTLLPELRASGSPCQPTEAHFTFPLLFCVKTITRESLRSRIPVTCVKLSDSLARCSAAGKGGKETQLDLEVRKDPVVGSRRL